MFIVLETGLIIITITISPFLATKLSSWRKFTTITSLTSSLKVLPTRTLLLGRGHRREMSMSTFSIMNQQIWSWSLLSALMIRLKDTPRIWLRLSLMNSAWSTPFIRNTRWERREDNSLMSIRHHVPPWRIGRLNCYRMKNSPGSSQTTRNTILQISKAGDSNDYQL